MVIQLYNSGELSYAAVAAQTGLLKPTVQSIRWGNEATTEAKKAPGRPTHMTKRFVSHSSTHLCLFWSFSATVER